MKTDPKYSLRIDQLTVKPKLSGIFPLIFAPEYFFFIVLVFRFQQTQTEIISYEAPLIFSKKNHLSTFWNQSPRIHHIMHFPVDFVVYTYTCMVKQQARGITYPWSELGTCDFRNIHQPDYPSFSEMGWRLKDGSWMNSCEKLRTFMTISMSIKMSSSTKTNKMTFGGSNRYSQIRFTILK